MTEGSNDTPDESAEDEPGKARALTLHVLRMLETRMDAAGIAIQSELQSFSSRLQLRVVAGALFFIALWGGIVLLAIVLPPNYRVPVLAAVVAAFVIGGVWAHLAANRAVAPRDIGSMSWFLDSLKQDVDVLSRSLSRSRQQEASPRAAAETPDESTQRSAANDLAA